MVSEIKQTIYCKYCGDTDSVTMITKNTGNSRSVQISRCTTCNIQGGVTEALTRIPDEPIYIIKPLKQ